MIRILVVFNSFLFAFRYFNMILSLHVFSFFLLVFVLLIESNRLRYSNGEFDSCAVSTHVISFCEGACTSSISADN
jgi:hypothetical protein